jgi:hypothetical protein
MHGAIDLEGDAVHHRLHRAISVMQIARRNADKAAPAVTPGCLAEMPSI